MSKPHFQVSKIFIDFSESLEDLPRTILRVMKYHVNIAYN